MPRWKIIDHADIVKEIISQQQNGNYTGSLAIKKAFISKLHVFDICMLYLFHIIDTYAVCVTVTCCHKYLHKHVKFQIFLEIHVF